MIGQAFQIRKILQHCVINISPEALLKFYILRRTRRMDQIYLLSHILFKYILDCYFCKQYYTFSFFGKKEEETPTINQMLEKKSKKAKFAHSAKITAHISHLAVGGKGGRVKSILTLRGADISHQHTQKSPNQRILGRIFEKFCWSIFSSNQAILSTFSFFSKNPKNSRGGKIFKKFV